MNYVNNKPYNTKNIEYIYQILFKVLLTIPQKYFE